MNGRIVEKAGRILAGLKFNYLREDDSELGRVDFGVLTVAMMVAALDGTILPSEHRAFAKLAKQCRVGEGERMARYESALHSAGYMMLVSRSGASRKAIVGAFVREAEKALPQGFAGGRPEDIRRALVIWIAMGMGDGDFCGLERACVEAFRAKAAEIVRQRRACRERLLLGRLLNARSTRRNRRIVADFGVDFMARAEDLVRSGDMSAIRAFIING